MYAPMGRLKTIHADENHYIGHDKKICRIGNDWKACRLEKDGWHFASEEVFESLDAAKKSLTNL